MVLADALSVWPASLLERLRQQGPLTVLNADDRLEDIDPPGRLLLGYRDPRSGLAEALAWGDLAFGCETQALVAAMACDLPAFSTVPPWAPPCRLQQASLLQLSRLEAA